MEFEYFTPWHFSPRRFDLSGTKKNDSICDKPPCPQDPDSWLAIIHQCNVNENCECAITVTNFFWGMLFSQLAQTYFSEADY